MELWHVRLGGHQPGLVSDWLGMCQRDERERYERMRTVQARWRFAQARLATRMILADHIGVAPSSVQFVAVDGRPAFAAVPYTSWSRSGDNLLLGIGEQGPLGVDIESTDPCVEDPGLWDLIASAAEQHIARDAFEILCVWTLKESAVKAIGLGLTIDVRDLEPMQELPSAGDPVTLIHGWTTRRLDLGRTVVAAVTSRFSETVHLRRSELRRLYGMQAFE